MWFWKYSNSEHKSGGVWAYFFRDNFSEFWLANLSSNQFNDFQIINVLPAYINISVTSLKSVPINYLPTFSRVRDIFKRLFIIKQLFWTCFQTYNKLYNGINVGVDSENLFYIVFRVHFQFPWIPFCYTKFLRF